MSEEQWIAWCPCCRDYETSERHLKRCALHDVKEELRRLHAENEALRGPVRAALAEPVQEPCAMRYDFDGYGYVYIDSGSGSDWQTRHKDAEPLYTAPPQRESSSSETMTRKPLTDEQLWASDEIMSLNADLGWHMDTIRMFARAIERAHGIGGSDE